MIADLAWGKNKCGVDSLVVLVSTAFTINYAPVTNALHKILRVRFKILAILCTVDQFSSTQIAAMLWHGCWKQPLSRTRRAHRYR